MPINPQVLGAGLGLLSDFAGAGMGMLMQGVNDRRQLKQQHKLMQMQMHGMKQMGQFNYDQQMRMWHETNIGPQMELLKEAGLNPGLFYKGAGAGGTTQAMGAPGIGGANAPVGGMEIMNMMMAKAQTELIRAQTEKTKAETGNVPLEGKNIEAQTASLTQGINNQKAVEELTKIQTNIAQIDEHIKGMTQNQAVAKLMTELRYTTAQMHIIERQNNIDEATMDEKIKIMELAVIEAGLRNELTRTQKDKTKAEIDQMAKQIAIQLDQLKVSQDQVEISRKLQEFETNFGKQAGGFIGTLLQAWRGRK